jgi:N-hydroxyarylamine O-acetyltransferase
VSLNPAPPLPLTLRDRILEQLGFVAPPPTDLAGLRAVYAAWCARVPFDNVRKMIALRTPGASLPGTTPDDFFEAWLLDGAGGTCWPSSHALWALLAAAGFDARRVVGSMRDTGYGSHGTVKARVDGVDWLVDSSLLTHAPVPCGDVVFIGSDPVWPVEVEPADDTHIVWFDGLPLWDPLPCRILQDPAEPGWYVSAYETSRERSPFNQRLYIRRNRARDVRLLIGSACYTRTAAGVDSRPLGRSEMCETLSRDFGLSERLVAAWVRSGSLDDSLGGPPAPAPLASPGIPPSRRAAAVR